MKNVSFDLKINLTTLIIIGVIILAAAGYFANRHNSLINELNQEIRLRDALSDSVRHYQNREGLWVAEKLTMQTTISRLEEIREDLTEEQQRLLDRINDLDKSKRVIAAALIHANIRIDSLQHAGETIVGDSTITFKDEQEHLEYEILVDNVALIDDDLMPNLYFQKLYFPNETFVEFHWQIDGRDEHPVAFSVTHTNPFIQTHNIESYVIPEVRKDILEPTGWDRIGVFFDRNKFYFGIGVGGAAMYLITR